jgi:hypothetical protein
MVMMMMMVVVMVMMVMVMVTPVMMVPVTRRMGGGGERRQGHGEAQGERGDQLLGHSSNLLSGRAGSERRARYCRAEDEQKPNETRRRPR